MKTTVNSRLIPHRQSTDTLATVDRNISADVSAECLPIYRPIVSTDGPLTKTTCRPTLDQHSTNTWPTYRPSVGRYIGECRSPYRPIVSTDTRSTDALSTHDPTSLHSVCTYDLSQDSPVQTSCSVNKS